MDKYSKLQRSQIMSAIRSKNTKPELLIRKLLFKEGFRFRIHCKMLPGTPDIVLPKYKIAIQIRGCFWHGHFCSALPVSNRDFWNAKIKANIKRDNRNDRHVRSLGWTLIVIRTCKLRSKAGIDAEFRRILRYLAIKKNKY